MTKNFQIITVSVTSWLVFSSVVIMLVGYNYFSTSRLDIGTGYKECGECKTDNTHEVMQYEIEKFPQVREWFHTARQGNCSGYDKNCGVTLTVRGYEADFVKKGFKLGECIPQQDYCGVVFYDSMYYSVRLEDPSSEFTRYVFYDLASSLIGSTLIIFLMTKLRFKIREE